MVDEPGFEKQEEKLWFDKGSNHQRQKTKEVYDRRWQVLIKISDRNCKIYSRNWRLCVLEKSNRERSMREVRGGGWDITPSHDLFNSPSPAKTNKQVQHTWSMAQLQPRWKKAQILEGTALLGWMRSYDLHLVRIVMMTPKHSHLIIKIFNKTTLAEDQKAWWNWTWGLIILWMEMKLMVMKIEFESME